MAIYELQLLRKNDTKTKKFFSIKEKNVIFFMNLHIKKPPENHSDFYFFYTKIFVWIAKFQFLTIFSKDVINSRELNHRE